MTEPSDRDPRAGRTDRVALYLTSIAAIVQLLTSFIETLRFPTIAPSVAITTLFVVFAAIALVRSWRARHSISAITIAALIVGSAAVVGSWLGPLAGSDDENTTATEDPPGGASGATPSSDERPSPTPNLTPGPTPTGMRLCASPPAELSLSWFLYQDAGADHRIIVQPGDGSASSIPGRTFSAAGEHVVYVNVDNRSQVVLMNLETEQLTGSITLDGRVTDTTISQDGETIVLLEDVAGDNGLRLWRPSDNELRTLHDPPSSLSSPALSPSADRLAWIEGPESRLVVADLPALTQHDLADEARDPAWSPDGTTVVYSAHFGDGRAIYAVPREGGESWRLTEPVQETDYDATVTPNCDGVVYARAHEGSVDLGRTYVGGNDEIVNADSGAQSRPAYAGR